VRSRVAVVCIGSPLGVVCLDRQNALYQAPHCPPVSNVSQIVRPRYFAYFSLVLAFVLALDSSLPAAEGAEVVCYYGYDD
jgi:hypothetical protein